MRKISSPASTYRPLRSGWMLGVVLWLTLALVAPGLVHATAPPSLTIVNASPDLYKTQGFSVPINFQDNGSSIASLGFTLDYDQTCLTFDNTTDVNNDGTPDAVHFNLPTGFNGSVRFTAANSSGEFKFLVIPPNNITPVPALNAGDIISIDFGVMTSCYSFGTDHPVQFAFSSTSFGGTNGQKITGATSDGTYTLHFLNHKPAVSAQNVSTNEDTAMLITLSSSDADDDAQSFTIVTGPSHGSLSTLSTANCSGAFPTNCSATVTYTPAADYNGPDSFTYKTNDGLEDGNTATVNITVNAVNDAPVADAQSVSTDEDTAKLITLTASDIDGDALTFSLGSGPSNGTLGALGTPSCTGTAPKSCSATVTYTPSANYNGADSFKFTVNDGTVDSNVATINITVDAVNDAPVANSDSYNTNEDTTLNVNVAQGVLANDNDVENNTLTAVKVSDPDHGTLTLNSDGSFTYVPAANYNGPDSFTYKANDGAVDGNTATVNITVNAVNDAPVADPQSVSTDEDTAKSITLTANDADNDPLTYSVVAPPSHGTLSGTAPNLTYTPSANYNGADSFTFKANDGTVDSNVATINITVNAVNDAPVAVDDPSTPLIVLGDGVSTANINVLGNDTDVENNTLSVNAVTQGIQGGTVTNNTTDVTYKAPQHFSGLDTFTYNAVDNGTPSAISNDATVSVNVVANDARADCNADGGINAGDFPAIVLEIFDNDGDIAWWKTYLGSFIGSPLGCDANNSKNGTGQTPVESVDAADISCAVLVYFDGNPPCTTGVIPTAASKTATATLQIGDSLSAKAGETLNVPITLETAGNRVAAAAFALDFDAAKLNFDPADNDNDGIPDAIHFNTSARFTTIAHYNAELSRVEVAVFGFSVPLPVLDSGVVATVTLQVNATSDTSSAPLHLVKASLGSDQGQTVPLTVVDQAAQITGQAVNKAIYLPLVANQ